MLNCQPAEFLVCGLADSLCTRQGSNLQPCDPKSLQIVQSTVFTCSHLLFAIKSKSCFAVH